MGTGTFFSQLADNPLFKALDMPGSHKYDQLQASQAAGTSAANGGPYTGITPTLAGANAGYAPGGPGANASWRPWTPPNMGGGIAGLQNPSWFPSSGLPGLTPLANTAGNIVSKVT